MEAHTVPNSPRPTPAPTPAGVRLGPLIASLVIAVALIGTGCGASQGDDSGSVDSPIESSADREADFAGDITTGDDTASDDLAADGTEHDFADDAEDDFAADAADADFADDAADAEAAMEEEASEGPARDGGTVARDQAATSADFAGDRDADDAEGLFVQPDIEPIEPDEPPVDRLRDNRFTDYGYRRFVDPADDPLSTFALDVDTGSYTVTRRWLDEGVLPPPEAVRAEEIINWFDYDYEVPRRGLEISVDGGPSPFGEDNVLVRVGVAAEQIPDGERPPVNLTFIVDTSGSMDRDDRLGLVKDSLEILVDELADDDTVAIVVYSSDSGIVLEPTRVRHRGEILDAIESLRPGGSTNLESGLREGYELAAAAFRPDGINRVIIASDGVANAGIVDQVELSRYIRGFADEGIHLVTVGYGMGNFNDTMMEQLADNGDGFYAYVDDRDEAERLFEQELTSTLVTAAIDAKIQVEFDPDIVADYRLIGFENRGVRDSDFRNDAVDAGELGAGHQATAMYEVRLGRGVSLDDRGRIGEVFLRWEDPESREVVEIDRDIDLRDVEPDWLDTAVDFQAATIATAFAEVLRDNPYADDVDLDQIHVEARRVADRVDTDQFDELVELLDIARDLQF